MTGGGGCWQKWPGIWAAGWGYCWEAEGIFGKHLSQGKQELKNNETPSIAEG